MTNFRIIYIYLTCTFLVSCANENNGTTLTKSPKANNSGLVETYHGIYPTLYDNSDSLSDGVIYEHSFPADSIVETKAIAHTSLLSLNKITTHLTPKDMRADETTVTEIISLFRDKYDRLKLDSLPYYVKNSANDNRSQSANGIGTFTKTFQYKKGTHSYSINSNGVSSSAANVVVHSGQANDFQIQVSNDHNWADGRSYIRLTTGTIRDLDGNNITDGTLVTFNSISNLGEHQVVYAQTIGGVAIAYLQHPIKESTLKISADCGDASAYNFEEISFIPYINTIPFRVNGSNLEIGPIISKLNALVEDGTPLEITLRHQYKTHKIITYLDKGESIVPLDAYLLNKDISTIDLECSGIKTQIKM